MGVECQRQERQLGAKQSYACELAETEIVFKLVVTASNTWRRLKGTNQLPKIVAGVRFTDGIKVIQVPANHAA
jgi:hypothetical protein